MFTNHDGYQCLIAVRNIESSSVLVEILIEFNF